MKLVKSCLDVVMDDKALASEVEEELECEDSGLANLLIKLQEMQDETENSLRCQKSKSNPLRGC